jgi:hypothetical protein
MRRPGAVPCGHGTVGAGSVRVRTDEDVELEPGGECWFGRFTGNDYLLAAFEWSDDGWDGVALDGRVLYELHVGTFSEAGSFDGVVPRLRGLREPDALYRELLAPRRDLPRELEAEADEEARVLRLRRGDATLVADFGDRRVEFSRG